jgi:hypothetical protein
MRRNHPIILLLAFLVTFLVLGIPYWQIPYAKVSLPASLPDSAIVTAFAISALLRLAFRVPFLPAFLFVGLAFPACILARVGFETSNDPTSHNLWPFEVVIAGGVGFLASLAGSVVGGLMAWLARKAEQK